MQCGQVISSTGQWLFAVGFALTELVLVVALAVELTSTSVNDGEGSGNAPVNLGMSAAYPAAFATDGSLFPVASRHLPSEEITGA